MIFAAVDVGSNAVRLLVSDVKVREDGSLETEKTSLVRVPLRLGDDTFVRGSVSVVKTAALIDTLKAFEHLFRVYRPVAYMACATAALREAKNGAKVAEKVSRESGIWLDIIDGMTEAELLGAASELFLKDTENIYLLIDVGGGSTEMSLFHGGKILEMRSFRIGTVRMLNHHDEAEEWNALQEYLKSVEMKYRRPVPVGSGGNINKLSKLFASKGAKELSIRELREGIAKLERMSVAERISLYGLRHDRADVIVPAGTIFLTIMRQLDSPRILVPRLGLSDGMIRYLYHAHTEGKEVPEGAFIRPFRPC